MGQAEFDVAFNDPELTAIIIGTPTDTHEALCIRALEANKHVLCEKPLAMTIQSSIRVINLAKSKNLTLLVELYQEAADKVLTRQEQNYFRVQAYNYALEVGHHLTPILHKKLVEAGVEE